MKFVLLSLLVLSSTASLAATSMNPGVIGVGVTCDDAREDLVDQLADMGVAELEGDTINCQHPFDFAQTDIVEIIDLDIPGF